MSDTVILSDRSWWDSTEGSAVLKLGEGQMSEAAQPLIDIEGLTKVFTPTKSIHASGFIWRYAKASMWYLTFGLRQVHCFRFWGC
jgi:hypothetical protein